MTALVAAIGDNDEPVPVDPPRQRETLNAEVLAGRVIDKRPIVPSWARSRDEFLTLLRWLVRFGAHTASFHAVHSPWYATRPLARSPRGGWRVVTTIARWVLDREQAPIREEAIQRNAVAEYPALSKQRRERVKQRATVDAVSGAVLSITSAVAVSTAPSWVSAVCGVSILFGGGLVGTPSDRRIWTPRVSPFTPPRLTSAAPGRRGQRFLTYRMAVQPRAARPTNITA